ncbi:alpha/beta hydrolase [Rhodocytophaga aerolata]|uniref:Alpha/beta hydrolase n=1 Tax=Rhodocytophaga aerolata TaxID=455078 RepID=A0ABT8RD90_9BACT|nr:alpha/beta hydrolase [Rhodocytophaga aerolata]MDO1449198.1 alpha/beta hydrolase [Rhodocytophaga aerolata]
MQEEYVYIGDNQLMVARSNPWEGRPTIIFLHDSLGSIKLWRDFPSKLGEATCCNVLVYDRQGYGKSGPFISNNRMNNYLELEADIVYLLIKQYAVKQAILFGHSDGGSIALITAAKYPSPILGVITEGAHIFVEDITLQGIREAVKTYQTTNLKERLEKYHGDKTDALVWAWAKTWLSDEFKSWNIEHFLPEIQCPVLVIQGEKDEYGTLHQVEGITSQVSGVAFQFIVPQVGHTPHKEAAQETLTKAAEFIMKTLYLF